MKTGKDWVFFKHHPPEDYFLFGPLEFFVGQIWNKLDFLPLRLPGSEVKLIAFKADL